jgi:hypothetical protein
LIYDSPYRDKKVVGVRTFFVRRFSRRYRRSTWAPVSRRTQGENCLSTFRLSRKYCLLNGFDDMASPVAGDKIRALKKLNGSAK